MKRKFLQDISANILQVVVNQFCGLLIFYLLSVYLNKNDFGEINWSLAVLLTVFGILACGIDQVSIRRIAMGNNPAQLLSTYSMHVVLTGVLFYGVLLLSYVLFHSFFTQHQLLLLLGIAKLMIFFSTPFKQVATGMEKFRPLLLMSTCSNIIRSLALVIFSFLYPLQLSVIIIIFIAGDMAELLLCIFITQRIIKVPLLLSWNIKDYKSLFNEALPQMGVAIFTSAIARFDWIFLGLFATNVILADYSFAYKVFEMATLPMLVIAPILIPRFTKLFRQGNGILSASKTNDLFVLFRLEMAIASLTALVLNILWVPVIDLITHGKYGDINRYTILILSASIPFLYLNNFLWTVNFAQGRLKMILNVFAVTFAVNIIADVCLIPFYQGEGAAAGYLLAIIVQSVLYLQQTNLEGLQQKGYSVLLCPLYAAASGVTAVFLLHDIRAILFTALSFYFLALLLGRQIRSTDWVVVKRVIGL